MKKLSANGFLTGGENRANHRQNRPVFFKAIFSNVHLAESVRNFENKGFFQCYWEKFPRQILCAKHAR